MILSLTAIFPLSSLWVNPAIGMELPAILEISEELPRTKVEILAAEFAKEKEKTLITKFGYDPKFEVIADYRDDNDDTITFAPHGFGGNKEHSRFIGSGHRIIFNFHDASSPAGDPVKLRYASFAQLPELKPLLHALLLAKKAGFKKIDFVGYSRGGAAVINLIGLLNNDAIFSGGGSLEDIKKKSNLESMGITNETRKELLKIIESGHHILICPMLDLHAAVEQIIKTGAAAISNAAIIAAQESSIVTTSSQYLQFPMRMAQGAWYYVPDFVKNFSTAAWKSPSDISAHEFATSTVDYVIPHISEYDPKDLEPMKSIQHFKGLKLKTLMHFGTNDPIVGTKYSKEFFEKLKSINPDTTYVHRSEDGHQASGEFMNLMYFFKTFPDRMDQYKKWTE